MKMFRFCDTINGVSDLDTDTEVLSVWP